VPAGGQLHKSTTHKAQFLKKATVVSRFANTKSVFYQKEHRDRSEERGRGRYHEVERSRRALIAKAYLPQKARKLKHSRYSGRDLSAHPRRPNFDFRIQTERHQSRTAKSIGRNTPSKQAHLREESPPIPAQPEKNSLKSYSKSRGAASSQYSLGGLKIFTQSAKNEGFGMNKPSVVELQQ